MLGSAAAVVCLAGALQAQSYRYSPSTAPVHNTSGSIGFVTPWRDASVRYMQIHTDLRAGPMLVREIGFRRQDFGPGPPMVARTIDCELFVGNGDYATSTQTFATNYLAPPANVVVRKLVNLPDITASVSSPEPFLILFPFDLLFVYLGLQDLVWDLSTYSNTAATMLYAVDGHTHGSSAMPSMLGTGCFVTGQTSSMTQFTPLSAVPGPLPVLAMTLAFTFGPRNAPSSFMLGTSAVMTPIPGLCSFGMGNVVATLFGTTDANGGLALYGSAPWTPSFAGQRLYAQGAAYDATSTWPVRVAVSNVTATTVPSLPSLPPVRRIWGPVTAATGTTDFVPGGGLWPFQLITRFAY